jgi:hypothetical protein
MLTEPTDVSGVAGSKTSHILNFSTNGGDSRPGGKRPRTKWENPRGEMNSSHAAPCLSLATPNSNSNI